MRPCFGFTSTSVLAGRATRFGLRLLFGCIVLMLAACGGQPKKEDPIKLEVQIAASADINPDPSGRASPVVVAVYQLATVEAFQNGDFFSVFDPDGAMLGDALLKREQYVMQPEEVRDFSAEYDPDTAFIGVVAAYRDIENATWRAYFKLPKESIGAKINIFSKKRLHIAVEALTVSLAE
jgi:type VI secretion system protein VasD